MRNFQKVALTGCLVLALAAPVLADEESAELSQATPRFQLHGQESWSWQQVARSSQSKKKGRRRGLQPPPSDQVPPTAPPSPLPEEQTVLIEVNRERIWRLPRPNPLPTPRISPPQQSTFVLPSMAGGTLQIGSGGSVVLTGDSTYGSGSVNNNGSLVFNRNDIGSGGSISGPGSLQLTPRLALDVVDEAVVETSFQITATSVAISRPDYPVTDPSAWVVDELRIGITFGEFPATGNGPGVPEMALDIVDEPILEASFQTTAAVNPVPEPATWGLAALGLGLAAWSRRFGKRT